MKQIIQSFKSGDTYLEDVPAPEVSSGQILIQTTRSLVSLGTERMLVEFGRANLIQKARQQPDKVRMVLDKIKSDGILPTLETVFNKLEQPLPLGYCNVGKIIAVGKGVTGFKIGDRVASNGCHAEFVCVPQNLCVHIPDNISDEEATFTVIGAIGLQGIRLVNPQIGDSIVVIGLGLIGLITAQLLLANGCNVIGLDVDKTKLDLASSFGINVFNSSQGDAVKAVENLSNGIGADAVLITASSKSNDIISQAAKMSRKRGKIVLVGVIGLDLSRADFYEKELTFQVSCSYGPGRYDDDYEQKGIDYPLPYVRWTEKRNFETVLEAISKRKIDVNSLISEVVELDHFYKIYDAIETSKSIASLIKYKENPSHVTKIESKKKGVFKAGSPVIALIGAGNYTKMLLLPTIKNANLKYIVSKGGLTAKVLAEKHNINYSSTNYTEILADPDVNLVMITTRHNLHASMVMEALQAGKHVFVEKPLALTNDEIDKIVSVYDKTETSINVGYNRRFSPHLTKIKSLIPISSPKNMVATMNAGYIPENVWIHDMDIGGGRIIGEACHYIDLLSFLSGSKVTHVCMNGLGTHPLENSDNASILLKFENGDNGCINYFSNGNRAYSKERIEVHFDEKTIIMDNFRETVAYGVKGFSKLTTKQDKGHKTQFDLLIRQIKEGSKALISFDEIVNTSRTAIAAIESMKIGKWVGINE